MNTSVGLHHPPTPTNPKIAHCVGTLLGSRHQKNCQLSKCCRNALKQFIFLLFCAKNAIAVPPIVKTDLCEH